MMRKHLLTNGTDKIITGSFIFIFYPNVWNMAYSDETVLWREESWKALMQDMHDIGIDTIIWSNTAFWGRPLFPGYEKTLGHPLRITGCKDPMGVCADAADELGMKIFYAVGLRGRVSQVRDYARLDPPWPEVFFTWHTALAEALVERYGSRRSFAGLYIPYEIEYALETGIELYEKLVGEYLRPAIGDVKLMTSPGNFGVDLIDSYTPEGFSIRKFQDINIDRIPENVRRSGIDIVAPQDYGGRFSANETDKVLNMVNAAAYALERLSTPLKEMGISLWANCETFSRECDENGQPFGPHGRQVSLAGPIERIKQQIAIQAPHVEKIITWIYPGVMNKRTDLVNIGHPSTDRLYHDYVYYLKSEFPDRFSNTL
jgi:hypothetical protein